MTAAVWDMRLPCDADPACAHRVCHVCKKRLHSARQRKRDHPGTVPGVLRDLLCHRCKVIEGQEPYVRPKPESKPKPDPLAVDERHVLLSEDDMDRLAVEEPALYSWCINRRWGLYDQEMKRIVQNDERITPEMQWFLTLLTSRA